MQSSISPSLQELLSMQPLGQWVYGHNYNHDAGFLGVYEGTKEDQFHLNKFLLFGKGRYNSWLPVFRDGERDSLSLDDIAEMSLYFDISPIEKHFKEHNPHSLPLVQEFIGNYNLQNIKIILEKQSLIDSLLEGASYSKKLQLWKLVEYFTKTMGDIVHQTQEKVFLKNRKILGNKNDHSGDRFAGETYHSPYGEKIDEWIRTAPGGTDLIIFSRRQENFAYGRGGEREYWSENYKALFLGRENDDT